jgi:hypothetical protein
MGYHSNVAIAVSSAHADKFLRVLHQHGMLNDATQDEEGNVLLLAAGKWYDGYTDVDAVMSFIRSLDWEDYRYIRVGEERGDVEEDGSFYEAFDLVVVTSIQSQPGGPLRLPTDIELKEATGEGMGGDSQD